VIESSQPCAAAATALRLKQPSNCHSIVLSTLRMPVWVSHTCTHARMFSQVPEYLPSAEGQIFVPHSVTVAYGSEAQLYEIKECTIVHFAATDATLIAYLPAHCMHECRCKGPLCADGIGYSVEVWRCCVTGGKDDGVVLTGQWTFSRNVMSNSTLMRKDLLYSRRHW